MILGGIWHGANWTYVVWGGLHGIALAIHKGWISITKSDRKEHSMLESGVSVILTFFFTTFCWIFFRADSLDHAFSIVERIFSFQRGLEQPYMWFFIAAVLLAGASMIAFRSHEKMNAVRKKRNVSSVKGFYPMVKLSSFWGLVIFFIFCGLLLCFAYTGGSPFIYGAY